MWCVRQTLRLRSRNSEHSTRQIRASYRHVIYYIGCSMWRVRQTLRLRSRNSEHSTRQIRASCRHVTSLARIPPSH